ncbi:hypothetical protein ACFL3V_01710 [Nanoarchaeota archaeon]
MRFLILLIPAIILLLGAAKASETRSTIEMSISIDPETIDLNQSTITLNAAQQYSTQKDTNISIPIHAYRGKTLKRTIYIWIEDNEAKRISTKEKISLPKRFTAYNLTANLSFKSCPTTTPAKIVVQGLDLNTTKPIKVILEDCAQPIHEKENISNVVSFDILDIKKQAESGTQFKTMIRITNPTEDHLEVDAWSYVYKHSNCYSGEREQNRKAINLPEFSNVTFDLENTATAPDGNYTIKFLFLRSDRKTPKEMKFPLVIHSTNTTNEQTSSLSIEKQAASTSEEQQNQTDTSRFAKKRTLSTSNITNKTRSGEPVYMSSSAKARKLTVYFLIAVLALILVALIFKRL